MPRPEQRMVTLTIDGREVSAPENSMLVDGAKYGDVEIPVFCYEPKLGHPVGACRMCLVEIEGIPKLQTACSTPVKDGMVVHTQTQRVSEAQQAVVEFLLINHPLDCPVCDKGGECPLQDISYGWGAGKSRFIEPKRHFRKPLELSPLIAIDRERCILCYRCVRFSQEVADDHQLVLLERGAHSFVGTFDGHPYVAPFSGNIIELCPVGALTSRAYRFRARPWDIEAAGSVCTLCPAQCNVSFTVRDDRVMRVLAREHDGNAEVDDGWLCDKGRFAYQSVHVDERITEPMVRDGGELRAVSWERALDTAVAGLARAGERSAALAGGQSTNEEGFLLQRLMRERLKSPHLDSSTAGGPSADLRRALAAPELQATVPDLEFAHAVLVLDCEPVDDAPILDLRLRKGVRRNGVKLVVASARPSSLDGAAASSVRFAPGGGEAFLGALGAALGHGDGDVPGLAAAAGADTEAVREAARLLSTAASSGDHHFDGGGDAAPEILILWGERLASGPRADHAARALLNIAETLEMSGRDGAGLLEIPSGANGRGLREIGFLPDAGPGLADTPAAGGRGADRVAQGVVDGEIAALYLLHADPLRTHPDRGLWERALDKAATVIAHESLMTETIARHATVVFPAEAYAEKEGTVTHPDGRLQRVREAIGRPSGTRAEWRVIADIAEALDHPLDAQSGRDVTDQLLAAVPFYAGLTLDGIGPGGVRWQADAADKAPAPEHRGPFELERPPAAVDANGSLRLGTFRSIWAFREVEASPALKFLAPGQAVELSSADAERLGLHHGQHVEVAFDGLSVKATVHLRANAPAGTAFLQDATAAESANALSGGEPRLVEVRPA